MNENCEPPLLAFPCDYPIKVMGHASDDFVDHLVEILQPLIPDLDKSQAQIRQSGKGNYMSVTLNITATGREQLSAIAHILNEDARVVMSL